MKSNWKILEQVIALNMSDDNVKISLLILYISVIKENFLLFHLNTDLCLRDLFRMFLFMTLLQAEFDEFENC